MLRIVQTSSAVAAARYYNGGLTRGDYFEEDPGQSGGRWGGKGAKRLGLEGVVEKEPFNRLCQNWMPDGSGTLTPRTKTNRRVGYDINFHCPKSVSVLYSVIGDRAILTAFRSAARHAMEGLEADTRTRVRAAGGQGDRLTGNLVWAEFIHTTSRPIGGIPDPHLHGHFFTFNATFDSVENRWKAAELGGIKRDAGYYEAIFHSELARGMREAGYRIEARGRFWEVAGISDRIVRKFSNRTTQINELAAARGVTDPTQKAALGAKTRRAKGETRPWKDVLSNWQSRLSPDEFRALYDAKAVPLDRTVHIKETVTEVLRGALEASLRRRAIARERDVLTQALRACLGSVEPGALVEELNRVDVLRRESKGERCVTTPQALQDEHSMLTFAKEGRGSCFPLENSKSGRRDSTLSTAENTLVNTVLSSPDRVVLLRGNSKTDQAIVADAAAGRIRESGKAVVVLEGDLQKPASQTRSECSTRTCGVNEFLEDGKKQRDAASGVIWVNRASNLGMHAIARLFDAARNAAARVVLFGNARWQDRNSDGDALRLLESHGGLRAQERRDARIRRHDSRIAVASMANGDFPEAFRNLEKVGGIRSCTNRNHDATVADEYARARQRKQTSLVISDGDRVTLTSVIRSHLRGLKLLGKERVFEKLVKQPYGDVELRDANVYERGQVVVFFKRAKGFKPGHRYQVLGRDPLGHVLAREGAWVEALPLTKSDRYSLFAKSEIALSQGDAIRVTLTGRTKNEMFGLEKLLTKRQQAIRLENLRMFGPKPPERRYRVPKNSIHRISGFTLGGDIKLENGWVLPKEFGHLDYGYCVSSAAPKECTAQHLILDESWDLPRSRVWRGRDDTPVARDADSVSVILHSFDSTASDHEPQAATRSRNTPHDEARSADAELEHDSQERLYAQRSLERTGGLER